VNSEAIGVRLSLTLRSLLVGLSVDEWCPSCNHSSTYGVGLNRVGGGPLTLMNYRADNFSMVS